VRHALALARLARPLAALLPERLGAMLALVPRRGANGLEKPRVVPAEGVRKHRVALLTGCVQQVVAPQINESTIRLLARHGCEVVVAAGAGCCGALNHHLGQHEAALAHGRANLAAWSREIEGAGLDAVIANASGCGTMVKDYGFLFRDDPQWAYRARGISAIARDVAEFLAGIGITPVGGGRRPSVAYQPACSLSHGQRVVDEPRSLLAACGFELREAADNHLCCGSAGTYNILQPGFAGELRQRKAAGLAATGAELVASGNIGCMTQLAPALEIPMVHTVELLDWATGGPKPAALEEFAR
jgi:glycolate oxidase iron-sulfur subunit